MKVIDRNPVLASLNYLKGQLLTRLNLRRHHSGGTAHSLQVERFLTYANEVVDDYVCYGADGRHERIRGSSILEIGPGDNVAVALLLLANGARSVTCVDGFSPQTRDTQSKLIYQKLYESLSLSQRDTLERSVTLSSDLNLTVKNHSLRVYYNTPIETLSSFLQHEKFDIVLSRAVLEHVYSPTKAWQQMVACLADGGEMWHKIDYRSHNYYNAIHPLYFLTIPDAIWRFVSAPDPTLNRERLPFYRSVATRDFQDVTIYITHILENCELIPHINLKEIGEHISDEDKRVLDAIYRRLPKRLRAVDSVDLLVGGAFVICRKAPPLGTSKGVTS